MNWMMRAWNCFQVADVWRSTRGLERTVPDSHCTLLDRVWSRSERHRSSSATDSARATTTRRRSASGCRQSTELSSSASRYRRRSRPVVFGRRSVAARSACETSWLALGASSRTSMPTTKPTTPEHSWTRRTPVNMEEASLALASRCPLTV